jgi:hypothetical protein
MHHRIRHHLVRDAVADDPSVVQDDEPAADPHHLFQIVLDQEDRNAMPLYLGNGFDLRRSLGAVKTGERFIEQNDFWFDRQCASDFEPLHLTERQRTCELAFAAGKSDAREDLGSARFLPAPVEMRKRAKRIAGVAMPCPEHDVVEDRHLTERPHDLVRQRQAASNPRRRSFEGDIRLAEDDDAAIGT